jgi:hypothetical protein
MGALNITKWLPFFEPFFKSQVEAHQFIESLELLGIHDLRHPAKIMMHQTQRLISISDDFPKIRQSNEGLSLLFLLICAENIAKLAHKFDGDGQSKAYVRNFFNWFLSAEEQTDLRTGITHHNNQAMSLQAVVDTLYEVRCDIVHEGKYWGFHFHNGDTPTLNSNPDVIVYITLDQLRTLVVKGCIRAISNFPNSIQVRA